jgi:hypothetical protein
MTGLWVIFSPSIHKLSWNYEVKLDCQLVWVLRTFVSAGGSCVTLQLQLSLVRPSPSKVGQFSFEYCPLFQRSVLGSTSCPSLGGWPVTPPLLLAYVLFLISAECWGLLCEIVLSLHSFSHPLCLSQFLLCAGCSSGQLSFCSTNNILICQILQDIIKTGLRKSS